MKAVCEKHGALFILDEVMTGIGRCGTLHAWEQEGVVPDIQTMGKGLGGGYAPVSGVLIGENVVQALDKGSGAFRHGQTYQGHPIACAAALAVQRIIQRDNLLQNVRDMGGYLGKQLKAKLEGHPNVGDVRGRGLFWGVSISFILGLEGSLQLFANHWIYYRLRQYRSSSFRTRRPKSPSPRKQGSAPSFRKQP